jgi:hypothetical protein
MVVMVAVAGVTTIGTDNNQQKAAADAAKMAYVAAAGAEVALAAATMTATEVEAEAWGWWWWRQE